MQRFTKSSLKIAIPSFLRGGEKRKSSYVPKIDERVVVFIEEYPSRGTVRYIGEEKDSNGNVQKLLGLELDERVGTAGSGRRNGKQLFCCRNGYAEFAPLETVILEEDFDARPEQAETSEESEEEDDFNLQSDDESLLLEQQGASLLRQSLQIRQDPTKQLELGGKQDTPPNLQVGNNENGTGNLEIQSAWLQLDTTDSKEESRNREDEKASFYRLFAGVMETNDQMDDEYLGLYRFSGLEAGLGSKTTLQSNGNLEQQLWVKEEQETAETTALQETEEQKEIVDGQSRSVEDELRAFQPVFSTVANESHEEMKEEERLEENLPADVIEIERRLREELTRTEIRVVLSSKLLTIKHQQVANFQRQLKKMEQQLTANEERKENFRTQLEKEKRLRVELIEKETTETWLREQLREKDQQEAIFQRQLREQEQQLVEKEEQNETIRTQVRETEQRLREEITRKDARETEMREQIEEKDQNLREMKQKLTKKEERGENLQTQIREKEQHLTEKEELVENLSANLRETEQRLAQKEEQEESLLITLRQTEQRMREELTEEETKKTVLREQLRERNQQVFNFQRRATEMEQQLTDKEEQKENLRTQLIKVERRMREETSEREARETELCEKIREKDQQLNEMEQQLTEKEQREENLRTQLRVHLMEQRLREEMQDETLDTDLREQLRERDQQVTNFQRQLGEWEQQWTDLQREFEEREEGNVNLRQQLGERDQQVANLQRQLEEREQQWSDLQRQFEEQREEKANLRQQLRERDQQVANFQRQLGEREQQWPDLQRQFEEQREENANLRQQVVHLENQVESQSHDWVIHRDEIQMTGKSLGVGGWGEVFEGRYCGCAVAVKRIHEEIISPHNQGLFRREIDIASRCRHPCLLQFIGATDDEESPLFVTELMESNLRELMEERKRRRPRLSTIEIIVISLDVARALNYLHQKKPSPIIHRDVSSANVLLWRQKDRWRGKVSDYGTAKFEERFMSIVPGCFAYSAPEMQSSSNQTAKIDVYSFGVLLCEMCIQEFPDPEKRDRQVAVVKDHKLQNLVSRCLQSDPRDRPDMEEIINELEKFNKK